MAIQDDGDIVRGLGFVALHAAYLEEQIDNLLLMLQTIEQYTEGEQRWQIGRKVNKAKRLVAGLSFEYRDKLLSDLEACRKLFEWRNDIIHGRIYWNFDRPETLRSGRPNTPERRVDSIELFELANNLHDARSSLYRPMVIQIPRALANRR